MKLLESFALELLKDGVLYMFEFRRYAEEEIKTTHGGGFWSKGGM